MSTLWKLLGVFAGGALPWLEAIIVVPAGILGGLHPVPAVVAGVAGNLITVWIAAHSGDRIRAWWLRRRARRRSDSAEARPLSKQTSGGGARAERVFQRWGLPALAVIGPLGIGTQVSAVVAVGFGVPAARAFRWIAAATVLWSVVAATVVVAGIDVIGLT